MAKKRRSRVQTDLSSGVPKGQALTRREFLGGAAAGAAMLNFGRCGSRRPNFEERDLPDPSLSGIEHIVVVMMENRSFDHFFGWAPGAQGKQQQFFYDKTGAGHGTFSLAPEFQGCQYRDPDHSYEGGRIQLAGGKVDGWLRAGTDDLYPVGYYNASDLAFWGGAVPSWTICDHYFCSILAETFPNRFFQHAAQTDRLHNDYTIASLPTIWDRLAEKGISHAYYYSDVPFTALWGQRLLGISKPLTQFLADAAAGWLPNVCFVDPRFISEEDGTSNDDHPFADVRNGQAFLNLVYEAVVSSPNWADTVLVVNYDEWGGFFDHLVPPVGRQTALDLELGNDGRLGFRVPLLVASPLARRGRVARLVYDHTSILKMIEWRWGLDALTVRDSNARNLARVLDFRSGKNLDAPRFAVPQGPFGEACSEQRKRSSPFYRLRELAAAQGFPVVLPAREPAPE